MTGEDLAELEKLLKEKATRLIHLAQELQAHERRCMSIASEIKKIARTLAPVEEGKGLRALSAEELRTVADAIDNGEIK